MLPRGLKLGRSRSERRPEFLFFEDRHRNLGPVHEIKENPSVALRNLLALADLRLPVLRAAVNGGDESAVEEALVAANEALRRVFSTSWSQANITVHLRVTGTQLHVLVSSSPGRFISIAERSDGLSSSWPSSHTSNGLLLATT